MGALHAVDTIRDSFEQGALADWETEIYECLVLLLDKHGVPLPFSVVIYGRELGGKGTPPKRCDYSSRSPVSSSSISSRSSVSAVAFPTSSSLSSRSASRSIPPS